MVRARVAATFAVAVFIAFGVARAQTQPSPKIKPLTLDQAQYHLRAGEAVKIEAPQETLDFMTHAQNRRAQIVGKENARGLVLGPSVAGD